MRKVIQIPQLKQGTICANPNMTTTVEVIRSVRKNVYEVRLSANFHDPKFAGTTIEMQRNQLFPV
mgnify:CR=1 FL=1